MLAGKRWDFLDQRRITYTALPLLKCRTRLRAHFNVRVVGEQLWLELLHLVVDALCSSGEDFVTKALVCHLKVHGGQVFGWHLLCPAKVVAIVVRERSGQGLWAEEKSANANDINVRFGLWGDNGTYGAGKDCREVSDRLHFWNRDDART